MKNKKNSTTFEPGEAFNLNIETKTASESSKLQRCLVVAEAKGGKVNTVLEKGQSLVVDCGKGHSFPISITSLLYKNSWCPYCDHRRIYGQTHAEEVMRSVGYELISHFQEQNQYVKLRCLSCSLEIETRFTHAKNGHSKCSCRKDLKRRESNLERIRAYAVSKGGVLLTQNPVFQHEYVNLRCSQGHEWQTSATSLLNQGTWCPRCAGNHQRTLEELEAIVKSRGGVLRTTEYRGVDGSYDFECNLGHSFTNMFKKVENGQWCPICSKASKSEELARTTFEQLFGKKFPKKRPKWLRNSRGFQMELDGYNEELKLAFEYQGVQHYKQSHWGTNLKQRQADDRYKRELCEEMGVLLVELTYQADYRDFPTIIKNNLERLGYETRDVDFEKPIDLTQAYIRDDRLDELRDLLAGKDIELLSEAWIGTNQAYEMKCLVCGNLWKARGNSFFNSRRVSGCDYCNRREPGNKQDISALVDYARQYGGKVLSENYVRRNHNYDWECGKGHVFNASFNNLKYRNQFCPTCESRMVRLNLSQEQAVTAFREFGYELEADYKDKGTYSKVRCLRCGEPSTKSLGRLQLGKGTCNGCVLTQQQIEAVELLKRLNIKPLEPFRGNSHKWKCQCLVCSEVITPSVANLKKGQGGCIYCYQKRRQQ